MEPGVPFALLGAVVLLAVAAWTGLAATAVVAADRGSRAAAGLVLVGGLVLAAVETVTGTTFGSPGSDLLLIARSAGLLLVAAGLWSGALARRRPSPDPALRDPPPRDPALPGVVVPLAGAPAPAALAAVAALVAALAAVRARRDGPGLLLAAGLLLAGAAAAAAPLAGHEDGALVVLLLRLGGALLLLGGLVALSRSSLLGKVVAAILAGVLLMATAAVGVVGSVVARAADQEQAALLSDAAQGRLDLLEQNLTNVQNDAVAAARTCAQSPPNCAAGFDLLAGTDRPTFAARIQAAGSPTILGGRAPLSPVEALALAGGPVVERALAGGANAVREENGLPAKVRLLGDPPSLALVVVVPQDRPTPAAPAPYALVFGIRLDDSYVGRDSEAAGFGFSLLVEGNVVASNRSEDQRALIERIAGQARVAADAPSTGRTVPAAGDAPTVHFRSVPGLDGSPVGTLALSRDADIALGSQRNALRVLLLTALVTTALVGGLALLLGRRTVDPLRRLTAAASRVAAGDLSVTTGSAGPDEVGTLSRTFDVMTGSVARLNGDLRAAAGRLETVLSSMSDGLVATDAGGRVTSINRAALAMAGLSEASQALGRPLAEVVDVRVGEEQLVVDDPFADGRRRPDVDAEVRPAGGNPVPVRASLAPLDDGEGVVLVLRDTTREREVERMKTEFLSNVSHELRTPLTPIRGYADLLMTRRGLPADKVAAFAATIVAESLKMNRVVDLLVDVAAIEAGRVTVTPRAVPPAELVDGRLAHWRDRVPGRAGDLRRRVATRLPAVQVDPHWVGKALDELIDNALKYTPAGTPITVVAGLTPAGDRVRLAVRDAGPGIAAADQDSMFLSFEQVDGSATRRVGGLGLGLSFVRRLAEEVGWPLSVSSTLGKGTEFALDLPPAGPTRT